MSQSILGSDIGNLVKTSSKEEKCWRNPDRETTLKQREIRNFGGTSRGGSEPVTGRFWIGFVFLMGYMVQRGSVLSFFDEISTLDTRDHPETPPDWIGKSAKIMKKHIFEIPRRGSSECHKTISQHPNGYLRYLGAFTS